MNVQINKSILAVVLCWGISLSALTQAGTYSGGMGTQDQPYQISAVNDWIELIGTSADWNRHFILTADLDFGGVAITPVAPDTDPSTYNFQGVAFTGVLDGGGHVLRNFVINQPAGDYVGLFGQVGSRGQVQNLGVEPLQVTGRQYVGGLCGRSAIYGRITSCYATGAVSGNSSVGGLCGANYSMITSCYATGAVNGNSSVGGLCGHNVGTITSCYATGAVSGNSSVGGLCGENSGTIIGCFWDTNTSGMTTSAGGTGKTTAQMKDVNTFLNAGWDFAVTDNTPAVWYMPEGDYPGLTYQLSVEVADVTGLPLTEAAAQLIQTWPGLNVVLSVEASDTIAEGHVIRQTPSPGSLLPGSSIVSVVIAGKPLGYAGSGIPEAPYQIDTPSDWLWLIQTPSDWSKRFVLAADLDFGGGTITPVAPDTDPSTSSFEGTAFTGVLDGGDHVLRNFVINQPASGYVGLFGQVGNGGQVRNLGAEPLQVTGRGYVGGLCGRNYGTITSCYATGAVSGAVLVGGLCGWNSGAISTCYATGAVSGTYEVGGLCGHNRGTITSCYATGAVSGIELAGGLCGNNYQGTITSCYATGAVSGTELVGGLYGYNEGTITSCYATGDVNGGLRVGGLCGYNIYGTITSCYATGAVSGDWYVGGLCGQNYKGTITFCYATGAVSGTSSSVGGLCGLGGTISGSFWDTDASGMTTSDGGTGKTTAQMQTLSTFTSAGWDFSTVWKILRENEDYPRLIWQEEFAGDIAGLYGVDLIDLSYLSQHWGLTDCGGADDCGRADIDSSGDVGIGDLLNIANDWLKR